jgi:hypothetical protein
MFCQVEGERGERLRQGLEAGREEDGGLSQNQILRQWRLQIVQDTRQPTNLGPMLQISKYFVR